MVFRKLWEELKMEQMIKRHLKSHRYKSDIKEAIFALVLNRILEPYSKRRAELWLVESAFRHIKDILKIRPIFLWTPARIRGHVFVCFLAFLLTVTLQKKLLQLGIQESLWNIIRDVRKVKNDSYVVRTELKGMAHLAFKAVGLSPSARVKPLS